MRPAPAAPRKGLPSRSRPRPPRAAGRRRGKAAAAGSGRTSAAGRHHPQASFLPRAPLQIGAAARAAATPRKGSRSGALRFTGSGTGHASVSDRPRGKAGHRRNGGTAAPGRPVLSPSVPPLAVPLLAGATRSRDQGRGTAAGAPAAARAPETAFGEGRLDTQAGPGQASRGTEPGCPRSRGPGLVDPARHHRAGGNRKTMWETMQEMTKKPGTSDRLMGNPSRPILLILAVSLPCSPLPAGPLSPSSPSS